MIDRDKIFSFVSSRDKELTLPINSINSHPRCDTHGRGEIRREISEASLSAGSKFSAEIGMINQAEVNHTKKDRREKKEDRLPLSFFGLVTTSISSRRRPLENNEVTTG